MKTQVSYESQRSYKLGRVIMGSIHRMLYSLQGFFGVNIVMAFVTRDIQHLVFFPSAS